MRATIRLLALVAACQAGPPSVAAPAPVAVPVAAPRDARTTSPDAPIAAPPVGLVDIATAPVAEDLDYSRWLVAHGATEGYEEVYGCTELAVGPSREGAVLCTLIEQLSRPIRGSATPAFRVVTHRVIRVVRAHAVITVLDAVTRFDPLDGPPPRPGAPTPADPIAVAPDGRSVVVGLPDDADRCKQVTARAAHALAATRADDIAGRAWIALDRDLENRVCAARGRYTWRGGRFVR